jgi:phosphomannomutase
MSAPDTDLRNAARAWIDDDPDPVTADELRGVLSAAEGGDEQALADLADRFDGTLEFGTAGLRGRIGAGPNRMNVAVVIRAAAGLADYLTRRGPTAGCPTAGSPAAGRPTGDGVSGGDQISGGDQDLGPTGDGSTGDGPTGDGPIRVVVGYDARHRSADFAVATAARSAADPGAGVGGAPVARRRGGDGHRQPQPSRRQRLQGVPRRSWRGRHPDRATG